jgi:hypothetical protein
MASKDKTFVNFKAEQAAQYAEGRGHSYPKPLYDAILEYHQGPREVLFGKCNRKRNQQSRNKQC